MTTPLSGPHPRAEGALSAAFCAVAGLPDDSPELDGSFRRVAQLTADLVAAATYVSVTALRAGAPATVAVTSDLAQAVDDAQYGDDDGPCLQALRQGEPVSVPDVSATMVWPGFREAATGLGLHASLSIPLSAASGTTLAALNVYGRDPRALGALAPRVLGIFSGGVADAAPDRPLDVGGEQLIAALDASLQVHDRIQQAIGLVMARDSLDAWAAYVVLRDRAAERGASVFDTATAVLAED